MFLTSRTSHSAPSLLILSALAGTVPSGIRIWNGVSMMMRQCIWYSWFILWLCIGIVEQCTPPHSHDYHQWQWPGVCPVEDNIIEDLLTLTLPPFGLLTQCPHTLKALGSPECILRKQSWRRVLWTHSGWTSLTHPWPISYSVLPSEPTDPGPPVVWACNLWLGILA